MATMTFTVSTALAAELNQMAVAAGHANIKAMVLAYLKDRLRERRLAQAIDSVRSVAISGADSDMGTIS